MKRPCLITFILACLILTTPLFARAATTDKSIRWKRSEHVQKIKHPIGNEFFEFYLEQTCPEMYSYKGCYILIRKQSDSILIVAFSRKKSANNKVGLQIFEIKKSYPDGIATKTSWPIIVKNSGPVEPIEADIFATDYAYAAQWLPEQIQRLFDGQYGIGGT